MFYFFPLKKSIPQKYSISCSDSAPPQKNLSDPPTDNFLYLCRLNPTKPMPMQYPLISEYITSIVNAEDNFATMTDLRPVLNDDGTPVMSSGNFAVVFKMKDERDGKLYAVKCFTREQEERAENYRMIAEELGKVSSPYITPVKWLDGELFVDTTQTDETEFPVLLMDWIEGPTLSAFLQSIADQLKAGKVFKDNEYEMFELRCLPANFLRMASWLLKQPFAHGDLKPDNIIVQEDGYCVLVDYDGMYVPAMQGMPQTCMGTPNFTHPSQTEHTLNKDIDSYAITVIALSLQAFALKPSLIGESPDFCVITKQQALKLHTVSLLGDEDLMADNNIRELLSLFLHTLSRNKLDAEYFDHAIAEVLVPRNFNIYNTMNTHDDLRNCYKDHYGMYYSLDGRRALFYACQYTMCNEVVDYRIREGVIIICDNFCNYDDTDYEFIGFRLPNSVISIGDNTFYGCSSLKHITLSQSISHIGKGAFKYCTSMKNVSLPQSLTHIKNSVFSHCYSLTFIYIPASITCIDEDAFEQCMKLKEIDVDKHNEHYCSINGVLFNKACTVLLQHPEDRDNYYYEIPSTVKKIGEKAFGNSKHIKIIAIPSSVSLIENNAFEGCASLQDIIVDERNENYSSFDGVLFNKDCSEILKYPVGKQSSTYKIPTSVSVIRKRAFHCSSTLQSLQVPPSVIRIEEEAFKSCISLYSLRIPLSTNKIEQGIIAGCTSLKCINISIPTFIENVNINSFTGVCFFDRFCVPIFHIDGNNITFPMVSLEISASVKEIDSEIFNYELFKISAHLGHPDLLGFLTFLGHLQEIFVDAENKQFSSIDGVLFNKDCTELIFYPCGRQSSSYSIPSSTKIIRKNAFSGCSFLKSIAIPTSITTIDCTFEGCSSLHEILVPQGDFERLKATLPHHLQLVEK